nr:DUF2637 domain-containing protein [Mycobacterium sp. UM_NZ2]
MSARTYWKCLLGLLVCASVAGNVGHIVLANVTSPIPSAIAAAFPPLLLAAVVEGLALTVGASVRTWVYRAGVVCAGAIAGGAFYASYVALRDLAIELHFPPMVAPVIPLLADAGMAMSTLMVLALRPVQADAVAAPATDGHAPAASPAAPVAGPVADPAAAGYSGTGLHLVPGHGDRHPASTSHAAAGVDGTSMTSCDAHLGRAQKLVAAGVVKAEPVTVATALAGLADGGSHRAVAAATGLHRTSVARLATAAEEVVTATATTG